MKKEIANTNNNEKEIANTNNNEKEIANTNNNEVVISQLGNDMISYVEKQLVTLNQTTSQICIACKKGYDADGRGFQSELAKKINMSVTTINMWIKAGEFLHNHQGFNDLTYNKIALLAKLEKEGFKDLKELSTMSDKQLKDILKSAKEKKEVVEEVTEEAVEEVTEEADEEVTEETEESVEKVAEKDIYNEGVSDGMKQGVLMAYNWLIANGASKSLIAKFEKYFDTNN